MFHPRVSTSMGLDGATGVSQGDRCGTNCVDEHLSPQSRAAAGALELT